MNEYQYILTYGATVEALTINPAGWDKLGITLTRHEVYKSVLRTFSLSLRFANTTGGGYALIKQAYETEGIYAEIGIEIKKRNPITNDYDAFYTGILDFTPGKFTFDRELFIEISIIDSSVLQKFISRDENEIDVFASKDLDDNSITPVTASEITLTPVDITLQTIQYIFNAAVLNFNSGTGTADYVYSQLSATQGIDTKNEIGDDYLITLVSAAKKIYENNNAFAVNARHVWDFKYDLSIKTRNFSRRIYIDSKILIYFRESDGTIIRADTLAYDSTYVNTGDNDYTYDGLAYTDITDSIPAGGYIELYGYHTVGQLYDSETVEITHIFGSQSEYRNSHKLSVVTPGKAETTAKCLFAKAVLNKSFEILTGISNTLDSVIYDTGGAGEKDIVLNGLQIRKYPTPKVFLTFKKLFESFAARRNIGLWYDVANNSLVVEFINTFFNDNKIFTFGEVSKFKEQAYNVYHSKIEGGYDCNGDYERVQGAYEYCINKEFSTSSKVKETKNIRSPYRGDSVGIEELRNEPYDIQANIDNNSDNDIFIIDTDGTYPVTISDSAIPYDGYEYFHTYYNSAFTPRQNAVRHGNMLAANSWKNTIPIKSQKSDKQFILEVNSIDENSDITVSELGLPLIIPKLYTFQYYLTDEQIQDILADPHGYGEFYFNGTLYSGYINKVELNSDYGGLANFELIARNEEVIYRTFEDEDLHVFENDDQKING